MSKAIYNSVMFLHSVYRHTCQMRSQREFSFLKSLKYISLLCSSLSSPIPQFLSNSSNALDLKQILLFYFLSPYPDVLVFHLCAVNPAPALSSSSVTLNWTRRQGIKTVLWLNGSISKQLQLPEILSSATIIFNEASYFCNLGKNQSFTLVLEQWLQTGQTVRLHAM